MVAQAELGPSSSYLSGLSAIARMSGSQLLRPPSNPRRAAAARRLLRQVLFLTIVAGGAIVLLMYAFDATEIGLMPRRGTADLWPIRILTDFGKAAYVLWALAVALLIIALVLPRSRGITRLRLLDFGTRLQFLFFAVLVPVLAGEIVKWAVGRGRPFVGGEANAFNFMHFAGTEAYASFPSAHAITGFALAFAVTALWPRARVVMIAYALVIAISRLVLLAHHPSDVVAGASIGVAGAMLVQYWFAARRLGFAIGRDGAILPRGALFGHPRTGELKRVARTASAS
jgi:membrane-associated phospholipid phosphatase